MVLQVYFQVDKKYRKLLRSVLEVDHAYPFISCNERLEQADAMAQAQAKQIKLEYVIQDGETVLFRDAVTLGEGYPMNILLLVNQTLHDVFTDVAEADKKQLLQRLEQAFLAPTEVVEPHLEQEEIERPAPVEVAIEAPAPLEVPREVAEGVVPPPTTEEPEPLLDKPVEEKPAKKEKKQRSKRRIPIQWHKKSYRLAFLCLFVVIAIGIAAFSLWPQQQEKAQAEGPSKPDLTQLIAKEDLAGVDKWYPKRWGDVIQAFVEDANVAGLKGVLAYAPSVGLRVAISFFEKDYIAVIHAYEQDKDAIYTKTEYAFIGFAYLTQGKLDQAEMLNLYADDADLKAYIVDYQGTKTTLAETNQLLKRADLSAAMKRALQEKKQALEAHLNNYKQGKVEVETNGKRKEAI